MEAGRAGGERLPTNLPENRINYQATGADFGREGSVLWFFRQYPRINEIAAQYGRKRTMGLAEVPGTVSEPPFNPIDLENL